MIWTDATQASERLTNTVVNYDKRPFFISEIMTRKNAAYAYDLASRSGEYQEVPLNDEKWNDFRDLPSLGWFNYLSNSKIYPMYLERKATQTRTHGISTGNTRLYSLTNSGLNEGSRTSWSVTETFGNPGYLETCTDEAAFPKASQILMALTDSPGGVAFSRKFCVVVTDEGMKWLYRKNRRIGFFTGVDSLNLFPAMGYYKEELQRCPNFDIANVKEF